MKTKEKYTQAEADLFTCKMKAMNNNNFMNFQLSIKKPGNVF